MTPNDYNLYKFIIDSIIAFISLFIGGSIQYKFKIFNKVTNIFYKENNQVKADQSHVKDSLYSVVGIINSPGASVTSSQLIPEKSDSLELVLGSDQKFILNHLYRDSFFNSNKMKEVKNDYCLAEKYKSLGEYRPASTLYIRVFDPVARVLEERKYETYAAGLKSKIDMLNTISGGSGITTKGFSDIISEIENIFYDFFREKK